MLKNGDSRLNLMKIRRIKGYDSGILIDGNMRFHRLPEMVLGIRMKNSLKLTSHKKSDYFLNGALIAGKTYTEILKEIDNEEGDDGETDDETGIL